MPSFLHTMLRVTDPAASRAFYEALGMEFRREADIVRDGHHEATLYFFGFPGEDAELELTYNTDGRSYELGTAYGHIAIGVDDMTLTLGRARGAGHPPGEDAVPRSARAARCSASSRTPTATGSS